MAAFPQIVALLLSAGVANAGILPDSMFNEARVLGSFQHATRVALNPQGWIYVVDAERNLVFEFTDGDQAGPSVGGYGWTSTTFDKPTGLATDGLNVYVADNGNHRIQRYDAHLNFISSFATRDTSFVDARFGYPLGVALSRLGDLFVLDGDNLRVVKFTGNVRYERAFGDIDDHRSRLRQPLKTLVGLNDHVFVLEPDRLLEFDYFGHYIRTVGDEVLADATGFCIVQDGVIVSTKTALLWFNGRGELSRTVYPADL
ncbi:MAG TPA: NHL repeat-containing protein, partial [Bacteroidota bacterium]|nr:NHL repeat-containing protein [Bacteroidota bacterium]